MKEESSLQACPISSLREEPVYRAYCGVVVLYRLRRRSLLPGAMMPLGGPSCGEQAPFLRGPHPCLFVRVLLPAAPAAAFSATLRASSSSASFQARAVLAGGQGNHRGAGE